LGLARIAATSEGLQLEHCVRVAGDTGGAQRLLAQRDLPGMSQAKATEGCKKESAVIKVHACLTNHPRAKRDILLDNPGTGEHFEFVPGPDGADWLYTPVDLGLIWWDSGGGHGGGAEYVRSFVQSLPDYRGNEHRWFFHDYSACSDDWGLPSVLFRAVKSRRDPNPLTVSVPHFVDDFEPEPADFGTLPYDVCFVGRDGACDVRRRACHAVADDKSIKSLMRFYDDFFGYIPEGTEQWRERREEFVNAFAQSKLALSPRGVELDAYRTWEAMSAGRPPVWMGDEYELPFEDFVDYSKFMFVFPESDAPVMNERVKQILDTHTDAQLRAHGEEARWVWLEYFRKEAIPGTFAHYLGKLG